MFKVNYKDTRRRSDVFIVNFEQISHLVLVFLLLTLNSAGWAATGQTFSWMLSKKVKLSASHAMLPKPMQPCPTVSVKCNISFLTTLVVFLYGVLPGVASKVGYTE